MLDHLTKYLDVPARILLALIFVAAGLGKLGSPEQTIAYMESFGVPGVLYYPTVGFELGSGLLLVFGLWTRGIAFLLAGFSIVSGVLFHGDFSDQTQTVMLLKNLAIAGGLLLLVKHGATNFALDNVLRARSAKPRSGASSA